MQVFFDDIRDPPFFDRISGEVIAWDKVVRTPEEMIELVKTGKVTYVSFDHDMGDKTQLTGYDVAKVIESLAAARLIKPIDYDIHSGNVVGAENIDAAMRSAWRFWHNQP